MRFLRLAVVVTWVGLVAVLVRDRIAENAAPGSVALPSIGFLQAPVPPAASTPAIDESWMGVYMHDHKIGYTHQRRFPHDGGYRFEEQSVLQITVLDTPQTVTTEIDAVTTPDHALRSFAISLHSGVANLVARGTTDGNTVHLEIETGGKVTEEEIALDEAIYLPTTVRAWMAGEELHEGMERRFEVFDPSAMRNHPIQLRVEQRETIGSGANAVQAWRVTESFRGVHTLVWFDDDGRVLREQGPMGLSVVAESATDAVSAGWKEGESFDLMTALAVPVDQPIETPRDLDGLRLRLDGLGGIPVPSDQRQTFRDGVLVIRREDTSGVGTYELPYTGARWQEDLQPTPFMQIEHATVRSAARDVLGQERDARRAADRLRRWVFETLDKRPIASIPNALQILEMKAGDCNEHAVLFASLARASGLPARVIAGTVYLDGRFLYHAWNEVWLGSTWVSVDPAFDQMPADATHIKLIEGGPEAHANLLPVIGQLSIEVLSPEASVGRSSGVAG